ncbi:hypothetical protein U9M48_038337 [Paspalum notatum var. saurae]|uniref:Uncharacterized protein n=1 Tax=Paspalum notatum var. saurae TaxID=547442 RepID=A0AAQ3UL55_PASNO
MLPATVPCPLGIDVGTGRQSFLHDRTVGGVDQGKRRFSFHDACMGVSPRMEVAPVQQPPAPPHQTAPSWPYPSMDAPSTSYMPMGPPPMSFPHIGTPSLQPMGPPAFTPIYPRGNRI